MYNPDVIVWVVTSGQTTQAPTTTTTTIAARVHLSHRSEEQIQRPSQTQPCPYYDFCFPVSPRGLSAFASVCRPSLTLLFASSSENNTHYRSSTRARILSQR
ncbi:hypothetical protein E2C01_081145 [Portunus trituberculatus]|uniref:Uncharacterized protein n=1 Tax=Portunus trituberculatus TaxID=210409 RepID=A0A5B7IR61_PORTR|nr:hypothetical protein [Portunus trituberculatus]